ncbi:TPA: Wzz/FepE/Etk N-terminal domain-containing protein [Vibrio diabolicus]|uniref:Wzz/FepE/Etk N-terminal domain-containing protein n=1 Tax=Vibrio TaxID=662 RepID=UPI001EFF8BDF|nr:MULTISPECIES: Wzz/FepE/Etk N-terminal domain-containing protein [Vibrio]MCF7454663.1 Wzz/FepE/Etk N-terminal domain-containing protein [Vibrio sp. A1-1]MCG6238380.1 Wzz/FepE/Etk N-terminal domain-containing protein [Vibrio diabolicus]MCG9622789.1 Wzz/FepE/Etk N-terminal domain-containing protein [Vibrio diabolicus]MCR9533384.1 Wzz/FepE/Etk N-terminal domain-containing protein [Vibrio alginolyticus]MDW3056239.1 Wzz/FepE/Etk N-terminal domain-containing protein [Vibrio sp. 1978]
MNDLDNANMMEIPSIQALDDKVSLKELLYVIWQGKWILISSTIIFAIASIIFAIKQPDIYKADALLAPSYSSSSGGLANMASQLGGLAALAGVNIGGSEKSQTELAVQVIKSRQFVESFITQHDLLVPLMAVNNWDMKDDRLIIDSDVYSEGTGEWLREAKGLRGRKPTLQEAYEVFVKEVFNIEQDKDSGLYSISVNYYSPFIAKDWVTWLIKDINRNMRERTISDTKKNLQYLHAQLDKTSLATMQGTFYKLIEEQTKSLMLAEVQEEFVFKIVDPAVTPEVKSKPKRALICIIGTFLGASFGLAIILLNFAFRRHFN